MDLASSEEGQPPELLPLSQDGKPIAGFASSAMAIASCHYLHQGVQKPLLMFGGHWRLRKEQGWFLSVFGTRRSQTYKSKRLTNGPTRLFAKTCLCRGSWMILENRLSASQRRTRAEVQQLVGELVSSGMRRTKLQNNLRLRRRSGSTKRST